MKFLHSSTPKNTPTISLFLFPFNSLSCFPSDDHACLQESDVPTDGPHVLLDYSLDSPILDSPFLAYSSALSTPVDMLHPLVSTSTILHSSDSTRTSMDIVV